MIADMIVVLDKGADLPFEVSRQVVVVEQWVPALDLSLVCVLQR